eukprot:5490930-Amphidinium_carterae.1
MSLLMQRHWQRQRGMLPSPTCDCEGPFLSKSSLSSFSLVCTLQQALGEAMGKAANAFAGGQRSASVHV